MNRQAYIFGTTANFFRAGDTVNSQIGTASRARTSNVATIVTPTQHGLWTGAVVSIATLGGTGYNLANVTITVINGTTFTYACAAANEATTADTAGVVTLAGTASNILKPGPNDSGWIDLGIVEGVEDMTDENDIDLYGAPAGTGAIVLTDRLVNKIKISRKLTLQEYGPFIVELSNKTLALSAASTQWNHYEGKAVKKGWMKLQRYDQDNNQRIVEDFYCAVKIDGSIQSGGADVIKPVIEAVVLPSILNTGSNS